MKLVLLLAVASLTAGYTVSRTSKESHAIDPDDFVYVEGLRLYDSKGLYYVTGSS